MADIIAMLLEMNAAAVEIDRTEYAAMPHYFTVGRMATDILNKVADAKAKGDEKVLERFTVGIDGERVLLGSQSAIAKASGISQSTISRSMTLVASFASPAQAVAAYKAFDGVFTAWVSSLVSKSSNRKGTGKGKTAAKPSVKHLAAEAKALSKAQRLELVALLLAMK